jgi:formylglycine-generating enzyme required for sulfatase activity
MRRRLAATTTVDMLAGLALSLSVLVCISCGSNVPADDLGSSDGSRGDASLDAAPRQSDGPATPDQKPVEGGVLPGTWEKIPKGTFSMGTPTNDYCTGSDEHQHQVTLTRDFELQATEVTQQQFLKLMGYNPSYFSPSGSGPDCGLDCPVESVSWHESVAYCNALSMLAGKPPCYLCSGSGAKVVCEEKQAYIEQKIYDCPGYRLPTEAEWEYAYRAGTQTAFYSGDYDSTKCLICSESPNTKKIGWYCANSGKLTHPVAQKQPNAWGLYDMAGNVREWCNDWSLYDLGHSTVVDPWGEFALKDARASRGGSVGSYASGLRAARRYSDKPSVQYHSIGFRCGRTLP